MLLVLPPATRRVRLAGNLGAALRAQGCRASRAALESTLRRPDGKRSSIWPVAIFATITAQAFVSTGRLSPLGPRGIAHLLIEFMYGFK